MKLVTVVLIVSIFFWYQFVAFAQTCIEDRVPSMNAAIGRTGGGTCWILPNGKLVTTAHTSEGTTAAFNIYSDNQFAAPEDIYQIVPNSHIKSVQDDWAIFSVYPNTITGKMPIEQQGAYINITNEFNLSTETVLRVTGHGHFNNMPNYRKQRTATGKYLISGDSGRKLYYSITGSWGSSGSPVIDEITGYAIGLISEGYCPGSGQQEVSGGPSFRYTNFWKAATTLVDQKREDGSRLDGTYVGRWNGSSFVSKMITNEPVYLPLSVVNPEILRGDQGINASQNEKYNLWFVGTNPDNDIKNHHTFTFDVNPIFLTSQFKKTYTSVTIKNNLEASGVDSGSVSFKDPWFIDFPDPDYGNTLRNGGIDQASWHNRTSPFSPNSITSYENGQKYNGVFLDQSGPPLWSPPYYIVNSPQEMYLSQTGRTHRFYLQSWTYDPNKLTLRYPTLNETPVVFKTSDAILTANLKGTQLSNKEEGYLTSSQRKFVRTDNGNLHTVYESFGKAWYEISTDNGITWQIANNGQPLSGSAEAKLPAIDYTGNFVVIVWQEKEGGAYDIEAAKFSSFGYKNKQATIFMDIDLPYSTNTNPLVAIDGEGRILFMWKRDEDHMGNRPVGLVFCYGSFGVLGWTEIDFGLIPTTNSNSINPTIVADKDYNLIPGEYHLAWEQPAGSYSYIKYFELYRGYQDGYTKIKTRTLSPETPSDGAGFWTNQKPSIIVLNDHTPRLVWIGYTPWYGSRTVLRAKLTNDLWSSTIYNYSGYYSESTSINRTNDNNYAFAFNSTNNGYQNKYVKNSSLYTIRNLNTTGKDIQVCNGTNLQLMAAMVFNRTALPYYFTKSTTDFSSNLLGGGGGLNKITQNDTIITFGRSGIASINDIEFVFNIGDILVGDSIIKFIDVPDTLVYTSTDELNLQTKTNNFTLTPTTNFYFSNIYSVVQISDPDTALTISDAVNFKAELVNANTNQVVGTFDNITYNKNNLDKYASLDYEVDCTGINPGDYYLRLVTNVNGNASYTLANIITDNTTLAKKNFNKVNFMGSEIPITYELSNNFPNPFNPSTTIRYQIPQDGIVTLKIYDILGSEVATLVNEQKVAGRYEVNFNSSVLASGVYIYKIQSGSFINSKKMILLK